MDMNEVSRLLNISRQTLYMHIGNGNLNPVKKKGQWYFYGPEVYRFLNTRNIKKHRHSPTNAAPEIISDQRSFSIHHIQQLLEMLRRFEARYEFQQQYMILFEFEKMVTSVFHNQSEASGKDLNEVLAYLDARMHSESGSAPVVYELLSNGIKEAFTEPNDEFDRRLMFQDMLIDCIIELTSIHPNY